VLLDYVLIHSGDLKGGPESLHAPAPQRGAEILVRRSVLIPGLTMYAQRGLIEAHWGLDGFTYTASNRGACFLDSLRSDYARSLRDRARWLAGRFQTSPTPQIQSLVAELDRWEGQFASPQQ
jgi:hypothetical protein